MNDNRSSSNFSNISGPTHFRISLSGIIDLQPFPEAMQYTGVPLGVSPVAVLQTLPLPTVSPPGTWRTGDKRHDLTNRLRWTEIQCNSISFSLERSCIGNHSTPADRALEESCLLRSLRILGLEILKTSDPLGSCQKYGIPSPGDRSATKCYRNTKGMVCS